VGWKLRAAPLAGFFDPHLTAWTLVVLVVGLGLSRVLPRWADRVSWRGLLVGVPLMALAWGGLLGASRGVDDVGRGLAHRHEYPAVVSMADDIGMRRFVSTFSDEPVLRTYPIHVQGHPVGAPLVFVALARVGLDGPAWAAVAVSVVGASGLAAVLVTLGDVAGRTAARRGAPFLVLAPAVIWMVASADALFAGVAAWATAAAVLATDDQRSGGSRAALAMGSGIVWGVGIHLSYGLVPAALVAATVVVARRRWVVVAWSALGVAVVVVGFATAGFWWLDGLAATRERYHHGIASVRPRGYFTAIGNPAAFSLAVGPALYVAVAMVRDAKIWLVGGAGLAAALLADASGLSKAEVERIWLPFALWALAVTAGLPAVSSPPPGRGRLAWSAPPWPALAANLLALQVVVAVAIESFVKTPW